MPITVLGVCGAPNSSYVAGAAALRRKIKLVPPIKLSLWRQRHLVGFTVADQKRAATVMAVVPRKRRRL